VHVGPQPVVQLFLRHHPLAALDEVIQHFQHARLRLDHFAAASQLIPIEIELELTKTEH
jgi:hypothetical protein